jgi:hypothetical protein
LIRLKIDGRGGNSVGVVLRGLHHRSGFGQALAALALLAMVVRALVPTGFMLAPVGPHQVLTVTLCSGHGPVETQIDLGRSAPQKGDPGGGKSHDAPCAFAAVAHLSAPQALHAVSAPLLAFVSTETALQLSTPGRGLAAPPPWSTGPPLTA